DELPEGTRLRARIPGAEIDVIAALPEGHERLAVVVPWSRTRFQYTVKDVARPASGTLTLDGVTHTLAEGESWAVLDHGRGRRSDDVPEGPRLRARIPGAEIDVIAALPEGHERLAVVVPWSRTRFQYTVKDVARPASGTLTLDGVTHTLAEGESWAVLDHGRGR